MSSVRTNEGAVSCLSAELDASAAKIRAIYGPCLEADNLQRLLEDRSVIPYPCELRFDADLLLPGEFGHTFAKGVNPEEGFTLYLHPVYSAQPSVWPQLVVHQLAQVLSGQQVSAEEAEVFGAQVLGLSREEYFQTLCELAGQVGGDELC